MENLYVGTCGAAVLDDCTVTVNGTPLDLRLDLRNHSPTGFSWGYGGSGPAQLALAILAHEFGAETALDGYQDFKFDVVACWPMREDWQIAGEELRAWMDSLHAQRARAQADEPAPF